MIATSIPGCSTRGDAAERYPSPSRSCQPTRRPDAALRSTPVVVEDPVLAGANCAISRGSMRGANDRKEIDDHEAHVRVDGHDRAGDPIAAVLIAVSERGLRELQRRQRGGGERQRAGDDGGGRGGAHGAVGLRGLEAPGAKERPQHAPGAPGGQEPVRLAAEDAPELRPPATCARSSTGREVGARGPRSAVLGDDAADPDREPEGHGRRR